MEYRNLAIVNRILDISGVDNDTTSHQLFIVVLIMRQQSLLIHPAVLHRATRVLLEMSNVVNLGTSLTNINILGMGNIDIDGYLDKDCKVSICNG